MPANKIIDLRQLLAERFPQENRPASDQLATGIAALDAALAGGLAKGAITEIVAAFPNAGSASLIAALLTRAARERFFFALVDGRDSFDPQSIDPRALPHLLWVRCQKSTEALQAADWLLRDGNFPLVILDLVLNPPTELRKIPSNNWYRLQRLVEVAPSAFLVLTPRSLISSAQWKVALENRWSLPQLDSPAAELPAQINFRLQRAQRVRWKEEGPLRRVG